MKFFWAALLSLVFLVGCVHQQEMYYWGDYSKSLYQLKKDPSDEIFSKHVSTLEDIIRVSDEKNLRVPPGIYGEAGFLMARQGKNSEAIKYFEMEKQLYPESSQLMDRLIAQVGPVEKGDEK